jgi:hypothetical protein
MLSPVALRVFHTLVLLAVFSIAIYQLSSVESKLSHLVDDFGSMSVNNAPSVMSAQNGASLYTTTDMIISVANFMRQGVFHEKLQGASKLVLESDSVTYRFNIISTSAEKGDLIAFRDSLPVGSCLSITAFDRS